MTTVSLPDEPDTLFEMLARDLTDHGFSIQTDAFPQGLSQRLWDLQQSLPPHRYKKAGVGRSNDFSIDVHIRKGEICWIDETSIIGAEWLNWAASLQTFLNARLFLGLFSFESHFSHYSNGDYYQKHLDAFLGERNRVLSVILYLNKDWVSADAGELVLYTGDNNKQPITVAPQFGTLVVFLSEEIPHEVLATTCDRFAIAGWFRLKSPNVL